MFLRWNLQLDNYIVLGMKCLCWIVTAAMYLYLLWCLLGSLASLRSLLAFGELRLGSQLVCRIAPSCRATLPCREDSLSLQSEPSLA